MSLVIPHAFLLSVLSLFGEMSNPSNAFYAVHSPAEAVIRVSGGGVGEKCPVTLTVCDWRERVVATVTGEIAIDAKGCGEGRFRVPTECYGQFRVFVRSGDVVLSKRGSCPKGMMTYAVLRDPATRPPIDFEDAFFGLYGGKARNMPWLGLRLVHGGYFPRSPWQAWGFVNLLNLFNPGLTVLHGYWSEAGCAWMKSNQAKGGVDHTQRFFSDPVGRAHVLEAYRNVMRAAKVERFPGLTRRIYEPISEPDLQIPDESVVLEIAKSLREALDAEDPDGIAILPGNSNIGNIAYDLRLIEAGLLDYIDGYAFHPYVSYPPEPNGFLRNIRTVKRAIRARKGRDLPLYSTEQGFDLSGSAADEMKKLNGQLRTNLIMLGEGFRQSYLFHGSDFGNDYDTAMDGDYGYMYNLELHMPGGRRYGASIESPRLLAAGISAMTWYVDGKRPTACLEGVFGEDSLGYAYAGKTGDVVIALWDFGPTGSEAKLPVGGNSIVVADAMGNETVMPAPGGTLTLKLGETPVYVVGPDPRLWGQGGAMAMKMLAESRRLAAAREAAIRLKVLCVEPAFCGTEPAVSVTVENRTAENRTVTVATRIPGEPDARRKSAVMVPAKTTRVVPVELTRFRPDPTRIVELETEAELDDGFHVARRDPVNFWLAERICGRWEDWRPSVRHPVPGGRPGDLTAAFAFGWSERGLAGDILVEDDSHTNSCHGFMSWNGDAVQMGFARQVLEKLTDNNLADLDLQAPSEITLALTDTGVETYRTISFNPRLYPASADGKGAIPQEDMPVAVVREGRMTHYRFLLPCKFVNRTSVRPGDTVRIAAFVNERDGGDRWAPPENLKLFELKQSRPRKFGRLVLGR